MARIDGGEVLVRCLRAEGVQAVFAIPDITYTPALRGADAAGIRIVSPRHESAGVHMAEGWARVTGQLGVALGAMGPGVANMVPGLFTAWIEGFPLLAIGTQRTDRAHRSIRRGRFQHAPQLDVIRPITKFAACVPDAARVPEYVMEAVRHALTGRPGPAYLEFSVDVLRDEIDDESLPILEPARYRVSPLAPDPTDVERAAQLIAEASFPLVLAGQGVVRADASAELLELVDHVGAIVMTSPSARGVAPEDHPGVVGVPLFSPGGARAARQADLVVAVGTEVGETLAYGRPPRWGDLDTQRWVQLDIDPLSIGVNRAIDVGMVADAKSGLAALVRALRMRFEARPLSAAGAECVSLERDLLAQFMTAAAGFDSTPIHPARLAAEVADFFGDGSTAVFDGGNTALWAFLAHRLKAPRSLLWTGHFGHLGTGLPYAIAAKLARPERTVYLFSGDSALGFNLAELETAQREGANIVVVVSCDYAWAMEALGQQKEMGQTLKVETSPVRFDQVARGLGCHGELVQSPDEIRPALERASQAPGPAVVHVDVNPTDNVAPPLLEAFLEMYEARDP